MATTPVPQSRLRAQSPQPQTLHAPSATQPSTFFYRSEENLQVLRSLLANREEEGAFLGGLREYMSFSGMAGALAHGFLGRIICRFAGLCVYLFTCPIHIIRYRRATARLAARAERIRRTLANTSVTVALGENRKPLSWLTYTGPWFFLFARARMKRIRQEIERHTGRRAGGWWMPSGGIGQAARVLRAHFEEESGTLVADPDRPIYQLTTTVTDRIPLDRTPHGDETVWERVLVQHREEVAERADCTWRRFTSQRRKVNLLQDALDRHWEFHRRAGPAKS